MQEIQYKTFSLKTHKKNWRLMRPNVCQFELTFKCELNCNYCYASCYNQSEYIKNELNTEQVKFIIDKVYDAGIIWLCFTGGDPLIREDFLELYSYARGKGLIVTIFTNGYSMTKEIADYLEKKPPFAIEMTLNAVTENVYERISQVKGSFKKAMQGLRPILNAKLPLKIKTQITRDNLRELAQIKKFLKSVGLKFRPSSDLYARLNGDLAPRNLRILPQEVLNLNGRIKSDCLHEQNELNEPNEQNNYLFRCAIAGGDGINIDPYGNMFPCSCIREPKVNLLRESVDEAQKTILDWVRSRTFTTDSQCKNCSIRQLCRSCPGRALLEKGNLEEPVEWFCDLAHLTAGTALLASSPMRYAKKETGNV